MGVAAQRLEVGLRARLHQPRHVPVHLDGGASYCSESKMIGPGRGRLGTVLRRIISACIRSWSPARTASVSRTVKSTKNLLSAAALRCPSHQPSSRACFAYSDSSLHTWFNTLGRPPFSDSPVYILTLLTSAGRIAHAGVQSRIPSMIITGKRCNLPRSRIGMQIIK